jgi:hypothetical protein
MWVSLEAAIAGTLLAGFFSAGSGGGAELLQPPGMNWKFKKFYGNNASAGPLAEAAIEALGTSALDSGFAGSYFFAGGDYKYFAFPDAWGTPTSFTDDATNLNVPMEVVYQVSLTNAFAVAEDYNIYRSTNILGGDVTINVA